MNTATYNFPAVYQNDGLRPFTITLNYETDSPVDVSGAVLMQLKNTVNKVVYEFSSNSTDPEKKVTVVSPGVLRFPRIKSWKLAPGIYNYDLQVISSDGFVKTYMQGVWTISADISR